jgi:hypothetical protein
MDWICSGHLFCYGELADWLGYPMGLDMSPVHFVIQCKPLWLVLSRSNDHRPPTRKKLVGRPPGRRPSSSHNRSSSVTEPVRHLVAADSRKADLLAPKVMQVREILAHLPIVICKPASSRRCLWPVVAETSSTRSIAWWPLLIRAIRLVDTFYMSAISWRHSAYVLCRFRPGGGRQPAGGVLGFATGSHCLHMPLSRVPRRPSGHS